MSAPEQKVAAPERIAVRRVVFIDTVEGPRNEHGQTGTAEKIYERKHMRTSDIMRGRPHVSIWLVVDPKVGPVIHLEHAKLGTIREVPWHRVHECERMTQKEIDKEAAEEAAEAERAKLAAPKAKVA